MRRKISILLAALLLISILPMQTLALESTGPSEEPIPLEPLVLTHINPLYADILEEADLVQAEAAAVSETETVYSEEKAAAVLRSQLKSRTQTIVISYVGTVLADPLKILNAAMDHTGVPTEGDYLLWQYGGANYKREGYISGSTYYLTLTYTMTYYTTAAQERIVDSAAEALLADLDLSQSDDYETVKAIYDWICTNVTYDYKNLSDSSYLRKHTAYAALVDRTAVCQGYALLLYRLLLTEGIDTRIISGKAGGAHGWNIIELDGKYYNADSTWTLGKPAIHISCKMRRAFPTIPGSPSMIQRSSMRNIPWQRRTMFLSTNTAMGPGAKPKRQAVRKRGQRPAAVLAARSRSER